VAIPARQKLPLATLDSEPIVRVRIARREAKIVISAAGDILIGPGPTQQNRAQPQRFTPPVTITKHASGYAIAPARGQAFAWGLDALQITANGYLTVNGTSFPHMVMIHHSLPTKHDPNPTSLDAVNYVALETYLPGVLEKELYSSWHPAAFTAQAIAARSYAVVQHFANANRHYEMEAGTASQGYAGANASLKARNAVAQTRGMVLVWDNRIVPGYYSSTCGGAAQDADIAFPNGEDIPPLHGGLRTAWCANSKKFRWGPFTRDRAMLSKRIAAWGNETERSIASLSLITSIQITQRNSGNRPAQFTLIDSNNRRYTLGPEEFRFACNFASSGSSTLSKLSSSQTLYSSHLDVQVMGNVVQFANGRGYGHGVGLCQFGAQGMAVAGLQPEQILQAYYPGAQIRRAY
jgi:stage II sporulation protein D